MEDIGYSMHAYANVEEKEKRSVKVVMTHAGGCHDDRSSDFPRLETSKEKDLS